MDAHWAHAHPCKCPPQLHPHPLLGDRLEAPLSLSTHIQMNIKLSFKTTSEDCCKVLVTIKWECSEEALDIYLNVSYHCYYWPMVHPPFYCTGTFKCVPTFPTFPLLLLLFPPQIPFFYPSSLSKPYFSLKGILTCYELHEVFPDPSLLVFLPSSPDLALQMPAVSPLSTACLCLRWLWALWNGNPWGKFSWKKKVSITSKLT